MLEYVCNVSLFALRFCQTFTVLGYMFINKITLNNEQYYSTCFGNLQVKDVKHSISFDHT